MAKKVSIMNMKGGVGKSTLSVNLAWHYAVYPKWSKKVLVVDADPQFNSSQYVLGIQRYQSLIDNDSPTIWNIFEQQTRVPGGTSAKSMTIPSTVVEVARFRSGGKIDLIPSRLELAFTLRNPAMKERRLAKALEEIEGDYDIIFIDCPPTDSLLTTAAYFSSELVLVPVRPEFLSSIGLPLLMNSMNDFKNENPKNNLELAGIVFNGCSDYAPEEAKSKKSVKSIAAKNGWKVFDSEIPYSRSFPKGAREGKPLFSTSYSRGAQVEKFNKFALEFAGRISL